MRKHVNELIDRYSRIKIISLIDKKGPQKRLGETFNDIFKELHSKEADCVWFDFHEECKKMRWNNLSKLILEIKKDLDSFAYFSGHITLSPSHKPVSTKTQIGVIRTNCLDSLDRTGVVQSVIARGILHLQLQESGLESASSSENVFEPFENPLLEQAFRNLWTNTGDQLSILYSGTKALKTDFTRTGKRTMMGAVWDGKNSLQRYYIGRFTDGYYQDALEFAAGTIDPAKEEIKERSFISPVLIGIATVILGAFASHRISNKFLKLDKGTWRGYIGHFAVIVAGVAAIAYYTFSNKSEVMDIPKRIQKKCF
eukprot:TRINITY_DN12991_c0_g12_i1.p1 TRINITY_DN12991_c0_g12~~TRINITY_DN12991_c0_g12_i1.p1  ORF type:complete len:312 (-),score=71.41 TRINITY_DN12991_c0_g12_i1:320-1255(-)